MCGCPCVGVGCARVAETLASRAVVLRCLLVRALLWGVAERGCGGRLVRW
jgi:hypothetical protein